MKKETPISVSTKNVKVQTGQEFAKGVLPLLEDYVKECGDPVLKNFLTTVRETAAGKGRLAKLKVLK